MYYGIDRAISICMLCLKKIKKWIVLYAKVYTIETVACTFCSPGETGVGAIADLALSAAPAKSMYMGCG